MWIIYLFLSFSPPPWWAFGVWECVDLVLSFSLQSSIPFPGSRGLQHTLIYFKVVPFPPTILFFLDALLTFLHKPNPLYFSLCPNPTPCLPCPSFMYNHESLTFSNFFVEKTLPKRICRESQASESDVSSPPSPAALSTVVDLPGDRLTPAFRRLVPLPPRAAAPGQGSDDLMAVGNPPPSPRRGGPAW